MKGKSGERKKGESKRDRGGKPGGEGGRERRGRQASSAPHPNGTLEVETF